MCHPLQLLALFKRHLSSSFGHLFFAILHIFLNLFAFIIFIFFNNLSVYFDINIHIYSIFECNSGKKRKQHKLPETLNRLRDIFKTYLQIMSQDDHNQPSTLISNTAIQFQLLTRPNSLLHQPNDQTYKPDKI